MCVFVCETWRQGRDARRCNRREGGYINTPNFLTTQGGKVPRLVPCAVREIGRDIGDADEQETLVIQGSQPRGCNLCYQFPPHFVFFLSHQWTWRCPVSRKSLHVRKGVGDRRTFYVLSPEDGGKSSQCDSQVYDIAWDTTKILLQCCRCRGTG